MSTALYLGAQRVGNLSSGSGSLYDSVRYFNTVADMVAATDLAVGQAAMTLGYYAVNDGGGAKYTIVAAATGTADGGSYIDITGSSVQAKLVKTSSILRTKKFGVYADGTHNDQAAIDNAIKYAEADGGISEIKNPPGTILIYGLSTNNGSTPFYHIPILGLTRPISFVGSGRAKTFFDIRDKNGDKPSEVEYTDTTNAFLVYYARDLEHGFKIGDFSADGNWRDREHYAETAYDQNCIRIDRYNNTSAYYNPKDILIENIDCYGFGGEGFISHASTLRNGIVRNCNFEYVSRSNGNLHGQVWYDNCTYKLGGSHPIEFAIGPNGTNGYLRVTNCLFEDFTTFASAISVINKNEFIQTDELDNDTAYCTWGQERETHVEILNNRFCGVEDEYLGATDQYACIHLREIETATIKGNTFRDYAKNIVNGMYCISATQVNGLIVTENHFIEQIRGSIRVFQFSQYWGKAGLKSLVFSGNEFETTHVMEYGNLSSYQALAQSTPAMTVKVMSAITGVTQNNALVVPTADETNPRIDLVYLSSENVFTLLAGTPAAEPSAPETPEGGTAIANILVAAGETAIEQSMITDVRVLNRAKAMPSIVSGGSFSEVTLPEVWRCKGNHIDAVYDNLVIPSGGGSSMQSLGSIPYIKRLMTVHVNYSLSCTGNGTVHVYLFDGTRSFNIADAITDQAITTDGVTGEADVTLDYSAVTYGNHSMPLSVYGHFNGTGGLCSIRVSLLDFDYYKL